MGYILSCPFFKRGNYAQRGKLISSSHTATKRQSLADVLTSSLCCLLPGRDVCRTGESVSFLESRKNPNPAALVATKPPAFHLSLSLDSPKNTTLLGCHWLLSVFFSFQLCWAIMLPSCGYLSYPWSSNSLALMPFKCPPKRRHGMFFYSLPHSLWSGRAEDRVFLLRTRLTPNCWFSCPRVLDARIRAMP